MAGLSRSDLKQLVAAILTLIRHHGGFATKTKLIKLLYLVDVESVRDTGARLTTLDWIFHLYGPWTGEYDDLLSEMQAEGLIEIRAEVATFINPLQLVDVAKLPLPVSAYLATRHIVERWALEPTKKLLDYVYFETEPMDNPVRGERLDFSSIKPRSETPLYRPVKSTASEEAIKAMRRKFQKQSTPPPIAKFTRPHYDEAFQQAVGFINQENE
jgi:hypothetical protein